jgi:hypothetical protein
VWLWAPVTVSARPFRVDRGRSRWAATGCRGEGGRSPVRSSGAGVWAGSPGGVAGLAQRLGCACGVVATAVGRSTRQPGCTTSRRTPASVHTGHARTSVRIGGTLQDLHVPIVGWRSKGLSAFTRFTGVEVQRISCVSGAAARQWTRPDGLLGWSVAFGSAMCCASADSGSGLRASSGMRWIAGLLRHWVSRSVFSLATPDERRECYIVGATNPDRLAPRAASPAGRSKYVEISRVRAWAVWVWRSGCLSGSSRPIIVAKARMRLRNLDDAVIVAFGDTQHSGPGNRPSRLLRRRAMCWGFRCGSFVESPARIELTAARLPRRLTAGSAGFARMRPCPVTANTHS